MQNDWRSLLYADLAVIDREEAWDRLEEMKSYGSGGSRANFLLWAATRSPPSGADKTTFAVNYTLAIEPQCDKNSACMALGLPGSCCPTSSGVMLGCCPTVVPPPSESST